MQFSETAGGVRVAETESRAMESPHAAGCTASLGGCDSFSSNILWSAVAPHFRMHDVPTTYGLKVFIRLTIPVPRAVERFRSRIETPRFRCGGQSLPTGQLAIRNNVPGPPGA